MFVLYKNGCYGSHVVLYLHATLILCYLARKRCYIYDNIREVLLTFGKVKLPIGYAGIPVVETHLTRNLSLCERLRGSPIVAFFIVIVNKSCCAVQVKYICSIPLRR